MMSEAAFFNLGCEITLSDPQGSVAVANRRHMELFGVSPFVCSIIWNKLLAGHHIPESAEPKHLLCSLLFLKSYPTETLCHIVMRMDEKTFRNWAWIFVKLMAD